VEATKEKIDKYINGANVTKILQVKIRVKKESIQHRERERERAISIQSDIIVNIARYILPGKRMDPVQLMNIVQ